MNDVAVPLQGGVDGVALQCQSLAADEIGVCSLQAHWYIMKILGPPLEIQRPPFHKVQGFLWEEAESTSRVAFAQSLEVGSFGMFNYSGLSLGVVETDYGILGHVDPLLGEGVVHSCAGGREGVFL